MTTPRSAHSAPQWSLPKQLRTGTPWRRVLIGITWAILWQSGIFSVASVQLLCFPLCLVPATRPLYARVLVWTKACFGRLTVFISQWFAPTTYVVSVGKGLGDEHHECFVRDERGAATGLKLPQRAVWIANHQTLSDWLYIWSFSYFSSHHAAVLITLKASIQSIPVIGWACRLWGFIALQRNWLKDRTTFERQLVRAAKEAKNHEGGNEGKLALFIFPEGTTVTGNTRPVSAKYAEKLGLPDYGHVIMPRSTGLFFTLRTLAGSLPDVQLLDLTIGYPGPTPPYWPEDYYDLLTWFNGIAPPAVHVHVRAFTLSQIPLGQSGESEDKAKVLFDVWLRERWAEKDALLQRFVDTGSMASAGAADEVRLDVKLRRWWEHFAAFAFFLPAAVMWLAWAYVGQRFLGFGLDASARLAEGVAVDQKTE